IMHLMQQMTLIFGSLASFDRVFEFFKIHPTIKDKPGAKDVDLKGIVEFDRVCFRYPVEGGDDVLKNASFVAEEKKSLAIVGESGAGKSTIISLLLRFYAATMGAIRIDGHDILDLKQNCLREQIGLVMQDTIILSGSVRQNMLLAKPRASDREIYDALEHAEAKKFVEELPEKLDTTLGERGVRLSGGQRQRLAISRIFLKNPPVVVLDEATSSLDTITEKKIQETMKRLFEGRTSIIIAHRLSTIIDCDSIIMLDKGSVLASGTHEKLLKNCPLYRELCSKQQLA
ncbi:MAG: ATP-binding cassette domain-containing protein, partial [Chitinivibrionales bacterium]|nr:ATP-binding cassette domain-containing protein [Chitinivibrionales bacterium]